MIDIENDVFDTVATALRSAHAGIWVAGEFVDSPAKFPAVTIVESDNRIFERMRTRRIENAVRVMYEVQIYSNKASGKKAEAKAIADTADGVFARLGFTRTMRSQVANLKDATIYRIVCRYEAIVGENGENKFLVYQTY
ncbi:MAG: hypothetical protein II630_01640 [Bacteroidales bacterium]|nr:hypothetical protein [Bacteroidales bacterium]